MTNLPLLIGPNLRLTEAGLTRDGVAVDLYDATDFRTFLTGAQIHICGTLEELFGDVPLGFGMYPDELQLVRSDESPWRSFARHSLEYINGDTSAANYLAAWCIAADIVSRMVLGGDRNGTQAFGDGLLAIRYIAGGAWRAAEVPESAATAYKMAMNAWLALGAKARLDGVPQPQDPRTELRAPTMPWLGPLHPLLGSAPALEDFVKTRSIPDFVVLESGSATVICGRHSMRWHRTLPDAIDAFRTAAGGRNEATVILADWHVVTFRVQKTPTADGNRYSFRALSTQAHSLSLPPRLGLSSAIAVEDPP